MISNVTAELSGGNGRIVPEGDAKIGTISVEYHNCGALLSHAGDFKVASLEGYGTQAGVVWHAEMPNTGAVIHQTRAPAAGHYVFDRMILHVCIVLSQVPKSGPGAPSIGTNTNGQRPRACY